MSVLTVDDLSFELKPSSRRRTLQITVDRSGELVLSAPPDIEEERLRQFVVEKRSQQSDPAESRRRRNTA